MKHRKSLFWLKNLGLGILSFFVFCNGQGRAAVKLNGLFCEHMVLQAGQPVPVWGTAEAGEKVTVEFAGQSKTAEADAAGRWRVTLDPLAVQATPGVLTARGSDTVTVSDVVVGDVWLASGQSNMGFSLSGASNAAEVLPQAKDELLRFFEVKKATAAEPQTAVSGGKWETTSPDTAKGFSAVAYFFAREIRAKKGCPVGVIAGAWGGTPIQIWISLAGLKKEQANPQLVTDYAAALKQWQAEVQPGFDAVMKQYNEDKAAGKPVGAKPQPSQPEPQNPDPMGMTSPSKRPHTPTVAFNAMIAPLIPYALRGAIWYQGEENGGHGAGGDGGLAVAAGSATDDVTRAEDGDGDHDRHRRSGQRASAGQDRRGAAAGVAGAEDRGRRDAGGVGAALPGFQRERERGDGAVYGDGRRADAGAGAVAAGGRRAVADGQGDRVFRGGGG
jgi:hypothetical protein